MRGLLCALRLAKGAAAGHPALKSTLQHLFVPTGLGCDWRNSTRWLMRSGIECSGVVVATRAAKRGVAFWVHVHLSCTHVDETCVSGTFGAAWGVVLVRSIRVHTVGGWVEC